MNFLIFIYPCLNWIKFFLGCVVSLFQFSLKVFVLLTLIIGLMMEYCELVVFNYHIVVLGNSYYKTYSVFDFACLIFVWIARFTPVGVLLCYIMANSWGIDKEKRNYVALLKLFQSLVLLKTLLFFGLSVAFEDTIAKREDSWMLFINSYSLIFTYFIKSDHPILIGFLPQLGCNMYVLAILYCHYEKLRLESKNRVEDEVAFPDAGVTLVEFIKI